MLYSMRKHYIRLSLCQNLLLVVDSKQVILGVCPAFRFMSIPHSVVWGGISSQFNCYLCIRYVVLLPVEPSFNALSGPW